MDILHLLQAAVLGLVQGLSEFLPISSSGHLKLVPWFFGWETPGLVFDTSLHLGTALALLLFFWKDFWNIILGFLAPKKLADTEAAKSQRNLGFFIVIGMVPAGIIGLLFDKHIENFFPDPLTDNKVVMIVFTLIFFGILLYLADLLCKKTRTLEKITWKDAALIGIAQVLALFPGTSRSGVTMTTGMSLGLTRETAARFSFLVGAPITFAAGIFKLKDLFEVTLTNETIAYFIIGFLVSALSGYLCIKYFLKFLQSHSVGVFTVYRILFALVVVGVLFWA